VRHRRKRQGEGQAKGVPEKVIAPLGNAKNIPAYTSAEDWLLTL